MPPPDPQSLQWHYAEFDDSNFQIRGHTLLFIIVVFSIIIFVILIFLFLRWICRLSSPSTTTTSSTIHLPHAAATRPGGFDPGIIDRLPIILHGSPEMVHDQLSQVECCICLGIFQDGEKVKVLPNCHHCYHSECVDKWLMTRSSCPLCRASLRVGSAI